MNDLKDHLKEGIGEIVEVYNNKQIAMMLLAWTLVYVLAVYFVFIVILENYLSYFSIGSLIIKTKGFQDLGSLAPYIIAGPLMTLLSFISPGMLYVYFAFSAIKKKIGRKLSSLERKERLGTGFIFFIGFYFLLALFYAFLSPLILISGLLYSAIAALAFYVTFYVPYALVIDDYSFKSAFKKGLSLIAKKPFDPIIWAVALLVMLSLAFTVVHEVSKAVWPNGFILDRVVLNELLLFGINQMIVIPLGIVLASYIYVRRYPMVK